MKKTTVFWSAIGSLVIIAIVIVCYKSFWSIQHPSSLTANTQTQQSRAAHPATAAADKASDEVSSLGFDKKEQTVSVNDKFTLGATIDPKGKKLSAAELHVVFDPKVLKLESIDPSDVFSLVLAKAQIDNEKGTASIILGVPLGQKAVAGASTIALFNFQAITSGNGEVDFNDKSVAAAEGAAGNVISARAGASITVR